ncbi:MAG: hypothetical protein COW65_10845 [Cytophagales bacterium CG18_big_fil_WC_8_21_14_2_50_42_9]|nr:MAG: hypothetical protein COW65_10845 [Cytophagales bacterium CG18_big_fil_WC_8_21_14_2_50_42_9]
MKDFQAINGKVFIDAILKDYYPKIAKSILHLKEITDSELNLFGNALFHLFNLSTCKYGCAGGGHLIESFAGRVYNHAISSIYLICLEFYDESLSLIRTIGEINNLTFLFVSDYPNSFDLWKSSDEKARRNKFSPAEVRKKLAALKLADLLPIDSVEYGELSELYIHVNASTRPNTHTQAKQAYVGGIEQKEGFEKAYEVLTRQTIIASMHLAKALNKDFVITEINKLLKEIKE